MKRSVPSAAYKTLGVSPRDDFDTIRKAWRALARAYHPDVVGGCPDEATRRFAEINEAYDLLVHHRSGARPDNRTNEATHSGDDTCRDALLRRRRQEMREAEARRAAARMQAEADAHRRAEHEARKRRNDEAAQRRRDAKQVCIAPSKHPASGLAEKSYRLLSAMGIRPRRNVDLSA